ncbi:MAG: 50S ribosomal protein L24 [Planctomycetota bacterium]|nr:MAG: 50S ribosomal protein L24 [Planctomycetota bacterium]REK27977.1 MAG: 50S ribosomal protein L24 [Planctomycetota bacterium]REK48705.1 MAG: 50S ribosomal protein L24 [Planctomycetota bacterium]
MHIRIDDTVKVIAGDYRGSTGRVLKVLHDKNKVVVEGINAVFKHVRRSQKNPQGGRLRKEMPMSASNVMLICPSCGAASRTGTRYLDDGSKERFCKKCGGATGQISPPKAAFAKK